MGSCPCCGDPLLAYQPWQRRNDRPRGLPTRGGDYVHAWCDDRLNIAEATDGSDSP